MSTNKTATSELDSQSPEPRLPVTTRDMITEEEEDGTGPSSSSDTPTPQQNTGTDFRQPQPVVRAAGT